MPNIPNVYRCYYELLLLCVQWPFIYACYCRLFICYFHSFFSPFFYFRFPFVFLVWILIKWDWFIYIGAASGKWLPLHFQLIWSNSKHLMITWRWKEIAWLINEWVMYCDWIGSLHHSHLFSFFAFLSPSFPLTDFLFFIFQIVSYTWMWKLCIAYVKHIWKKKFDFIFFRHVYYTVYKFTDAHIYIYIS